VLLEEFSDILNFPLIYLSILIYIKNEFCLLAFLSLGVKSYTRERSVGFEREALHFVGRSIKMSDN